LPPMQKAPARELRLELRSLAAPVAEGPGGGGRSLSFALSGARVIAANGR
jgi:hypothetical protein